MGVLVVLVVSSIKITTLVDRRKVVITRIDSTRTHVVEPDTFRMVSHFRVVDKRLTDREETSYIAVTMRMVKVLIFSVDLCVGSNHRIRVALDLVVRV